MTDPTRIDWSGLFDEVVPEPPASSEEIDAFLTDLTRALSPDEIAEIKRAQLNPWPESHQWHAGWRPFDPTIWRLPHVDLPASYLSFLRWSRAPWVRKGERTLGHLGTTSTREYLLSYEFPQYLPGVLPIGLDGGSIFAAFDLRLRPVHGEYPIIAVEAGVLDFEETRVIASSFLELCTGSISLREALRPRGAA